MPLLVSSSMQRLDPPIKCAICGHPILWKQSRVTDNGELVHEECLLAKRKSAPDPRGVESVMLGSSAPLASLPICITTA